MDKIRIQGGAPLKGKITISGAKNAALPLMCASLLTDQPLHLSNMPHLADITTLASLLAQLGVRISLGDDESKNGHEGRILTLHAKDLASTTAPYELVRKMRASILVLGPILARAGKAKVSLPGGCAIGSRPVDLHLKGLEALGADIQIEEGYVIAAAPNGLKGGAFTFPVVSVGATENVLMAATLAEGTTVLKNVAREPEIGDLAMCLNALGANIEGIGTGTLTIEGTEALHSAEHAVIADRIETATYAIAAAITGGEIELLNTNGDSLGGVMQALRNTSAQIEEGTNRLSVRSGNSIEPVDIITQPYPGFATDVQAQMVALMCFAKGTSSITETIFENRFMHVPELRRMGADITLNGSTAVIKGVAALKGAEVMATDLRASVCLVLAGLAAEGETVISRVYHIDRGYERVEEKLTACGAKIERLRN